MCRRKLFRRRMSSWGVRPDPRRRAPNPSDTKESMSRIKSPLMVKGDYPVKIKLLRYKFKYEEWSDMTGPKIEG